MIEKIFESGKISPKEYKLYLLFHLSEGGREWLDDAIQKTFMEEPGDAEFNAVGFAWFDGRRSLIRNIIKTIEKVTSILKEENYVGAGQQG